MILLAQVPVPHIDWFQILLDKGLTFALVGIGIWLATKYGPQFIERHLSFMASSEKSQAILADAYKTLSERDDVARTNRALAHFANAAKEITDHEQAHKHIERGLDELSR